MTICLISRLCMHDRGGWSAHARAAINFNKLDDASSPYDASLSVIQVRPRTYHFSRVPLKHVPLCILAIYVNYILRISLSLSMCAFVTATISSISFIKRQIAKYLHKKINTGCLSRPETPSFKNQNDIFSFDRASLLFQHANNIIQLDIFLI